MKTSIKITALIILSLAISMSSALALSIVSIDSPTLKPGEQGSLTIEVENDQSTDVEDVSMSLDLTNVPISAVGSTDDLIDEINEDDNEKFSFTLRASVDARPGDYKIPYTLNYKNLTAPRKGTIGVKISADSNLDFTVSTENPVVGQQGKITLKIVNKGLADARFVSVKLFPEGYTLLSEDQVYIGTIDSDDFEIAEFDVIFKSQSSDLTAQVEYLDFDNNKKVENLQIPVKVYTMEKAIELGIVKKSNAGLYVGIVIALIIIWFVYRAIRKRSRMKKSMQKSDRS